MDKLKTSIAMAAYNGERFLQQQLNSFLTQTVLPDELIVCDDGSTDSTPDILREYAKIAPFPVKLYFNEKNLGYAKNFEKAASLCSGDIIFFSDQDDIWLPQKISKCMEIFEAEPSVGLVLSYYDSLDIDGNLVPQKSPKSFGPDSIPLENLPEDIKKRSIQVFLERHPRGWMGCMFAYRKSYNAWLMPFCDYMSHDFWTLNLLGTCSQTRFIPEALIQYRQYAGSVSSRQTRHKINRIARLFIRLSYVIKRQTTKDYYRFLIKRISKTGAPVLFPELLKFFQEYGTVKFYLKRWYNYFVYGKYR